ncbi:hypothetical protein B1690_17585 [Geobacillus sp. 46C-IIa]|nr:hypothetical protein B1690_17585 [Geobacillus sp. 46C-IIa]
MFFISSLFSLCVIFLYTSIGFLGNWNPNSMSMFTTFGLLGFFIPFFLSNSNKKKMFYFTFILLSIYFVYLTDSRNNIMIFSILLFSILTYKINQRKILFRLYYIIAFLSPYIAGKAVSFISESKYYEAILVYSYKYFGKTSLTSGREQFWAYIEKLIGGNWLLGTGKSLYNIIYSHNIFYSVQYFFGAIGYFLYVVFIVFVLEYIYKNAKKDKISMGCVYLFIAIFFGQAAENALFTSDTSYYLPYVYLSIGIFRAKYIKINSKKTSMSKFYSPPKHENAAHG